MVLLHLGTPRDQEAHDQLAVALPDATVTPPDAAGAFDIGLEAPDLEHALQRVWTRSPRPRPTITSRSSSTRTCPSTGAI